MKPAPIPLPGFPRWTGAHVNVRIGPSDGPGALALITSVRLTRRARLWAAWRYATGQEVSTE